jgi:hypothetical protein
MLAISCLPAEMPVAELPVAELPVAELPAALSPHQNPRLPRSPAVIKPKKYFFKFFIFFGSNAKIGNFWKLLRFLFMLQNLINITLYSFQCQ